MTIKAIKTLALAGVAAIGLAFVPAIAGAAGGGDTGSYKMEHKHWHFNGLRGMYDTEAAQRGYQVYKEVCSSCHALEPE